jgi:hypothetical protein
VLFARPTRAGIVTANLGGCTHECFGSAVVMRVVMAMVAMWPVDVTVVTILIEDGVGLGGK